MSYFCIISYLRISNKIFWIAPHSSQGHSDLYLNLFSWQENKCRDGLEGHCKQYFQVSREEKGLLNPSNTVILLEVLSVVALTNTRVEIQKLVWKIEWDIGNK